ncbi:NUDIX domain-containing protein [Enterococcus sp. LJL51]|uniref:NUDIX domain-containing protein n=1 Tax=Enterococcus sp. LJL51 TaxID=3416656 RepID=UPI003CEB8A19
MLKVACYKLAEKPDHLIDFSVIIAKSNSKYVFVKHRQRDSLEIPGGHRENNESIEECARRELYEETGATNYSIKPLFIYGVKKGEHSLEDYGMVFFAEIFERKAQLEYEIEKIFLFKKNPLIGLIH